MSKKWWIIVPLLAGMLAGRGSIAGMGPDSDWLEPPLDYRSVGERVRTQSEQDRIRRALCNTGKIKLGTALYYRCGLDRSNETVADAPKATGSSTSKGTLGAPQTGNPLGGSTDKQGIGLSNNEERGLLDTMAMAGWFSNRGNGDNGAVDAGGTGGSDASDDTGGWTYMDIGGD